MGGHVSWLLEVEVTSGREEDARALIEEMVQSAQANEPGTRVYDAAVSADGRVCHFYERYADDGAALTHLTAFGEQFADRFLQVFTPIRFVVYGAPNDAVREALDGFHPVYLQHAAGFAR